MRTYIFTKRERQTIINFLIGATPRNDPNLMVIISRIKSFSDISHDVDLYDRLRKAITTNTT